MKTIYYFCALVLLSSCAGNSEEITLRLNQKIGDTFTISTLTEAKGGPSDISYGTDYKFKVTAASEDKITYDVNVIFTENDTAELFPDGDMDAELEALTKDTYSITFNTDGSIDKNFTTSSGEAFGELVDATNFFIQYPSHTVNEGFSWNVDQAPTLLGQKVEATYTVDEISPNAVVLDYEGKIEAGSILGTMTKRGEYTIDRNSGVIKYGKFTSNMMMGGKAIFTFKRIP